MLLPPSWTQPELTTVKEFPVEGKRLLWKLFAHFGEEVERGISNGGKEAVMDGPAIALFLHQVI